MEDLVTQDKIAEIVSQSFPEFELLSYDIHEEEKKAQFLSIINVITARIKSKLDSKEQDVHIFLKSIPRNPFKHEMALKSKHFKREISMYNEVLPLLHNLRGFSSYPKVYYAFSNDSTDFLALENLKLSWFKSADRLPGLDFNHLKVVIKSLAELHASSFSVFQDGKEILNKFPEFVDFFFRGSSDDTLSEMAQLCLPNTTTSIRKVLEDEGLNNLIPKMEYFLGEYATQNALKLLKIPERFPSVINHGDMWTSNLMFLYDQESPVDLKLLDFQAAKVGSRILDLSYLIFTSANTSLLQAESINSLLRVYFDFFNEACQRFNTPLEFSSHKLDWNYLLEEWETYNTYGLIMAVLFTFIMYCPPDDIPNAEEMVAEDMDANSTNMFDKLWDHKAMRFRLIHLIQTHIPNLPNSL